MGAASSVKRSRITYLQMVTLMIHFQLDLGNMEAVTLLMVNRSCKFVGKHLRLYKKHCAKLGLDEKKMVDFRKAWSATISCKDELTEMSNYGTTGKIPDPDARKPVSCEGEWTPSMIYDPYGVYLMHAAVLQIYAKGGNTGSVLRVVLRTGQDTTKVLVRKTVNRLPSKDCVSFTNDASRQCSIEHTTQDGDQLVLYQQHCGEQLYPSSFESWEDTGFEEWLSCIAEMHKMGMSNPDIKLANYCITDEGKIMCVDNQDTVKWRNYTGVDRVVAVTKTTSPPELVDGNCIRTINEARKIIGLPSGGYILWWDVVALVSSIPLHGISDEFKRFLDTLKGFRPTDGKNPSAEDALRTYHMWQDARAKNLQVDVIAELSK